MAYEVVLPRLGWNMETGRVGEWLKRDGERVEAGELLFTVEGDKATQEVEALDSGILRIPADAPRPGQELPVGTLLAYLVEPGEELPGAANAEPAGLPVAVVAQAPAAAAPSTNAAAGADGEPAISPRARRVAGELGVDWTRVQGSGRTGRIVERDVRAAHAAVQAKAISPDKISPLARRLAAELNVDAEALAASMPGKRVERADVEQAARRAAEKTAAAALTPAPVTPLATPAAAPIAGEITPISFVRRTIAERMSTSSRTTAPVTLTTEADATELVRLRKQLKEDGKLTPSYNDLLAKLCAAALAEHPQLNSRFEGEGILRAMTVNIGVAVDAERGLLVPVLRDVQAKSLRQIAAESAALVEKARAGKIGPDDLSAGTFTITNLGMYEIDAFTPIINLPECAILGVGRIVPKQVVIDADAEKIAIRHMVFLSLTFDHRLVDGAPAARFLQQVKEFVEKPYLWLVG